MKWLGKAVLPSLLMMLTAGCFSVTYVGQDFPPLPDGHAVLFFNHRNPVPAGMYQSIGHAEIEIPKGVDAIAIREKISDIAREHGASAVSIVKQEKRLVNRYYSGGSSSDSSMISNVSTTGALMLRPDGSYTGVNSFGDVVQSNRTYHEEYRTVVKILLMMPVKDYERALAERRDAAAWVPAEAEPAAKAADKTTDKATDKVTDKTANKAIKP